MSSWTLKFDKVLFHSEHAIELDQEDGVMKRNTSRVMKHNPILQGVMLPIHRREKLHDRPRSLPLSSCPNILPSP
jgi:hypothetical protein